MRQTLEGTATERHTCGLNVLLSFPVDYKHLQIVGFVHYRGLVCAGWHCSNGRGQVNA